ncbi:interleukin-4 receptor subunit alpha isoform X3 [Lepidochelys kempii]|uniref:interleukin-4 receptor subunit alpha isoform X3 n=1 Tax=Lepidochelys kempii TaxID=8472 RepID=UPI003C6FC539
MADSLKAAVLALWTLFFSCATYHILATGRIQRFECFTDYARELSCHWEAAAQTNCSKEFRLYYKKEILSTVGLLALPQQKPVPACSPQLITVSPQRHASGITLNRYNTCIPETGKGSSMNSVSNCICIILPEYFAAGLAYHLTLQANGTVLWNDTVEVAYIVKPRPPTNLTIEKGENDNFYVLRWIESYSAGDMLYGEEVTYEVKYWNKQNPEEEFVEQLPYQTTHFKILAMQLKQGYDYLVRVRRNYTGSYSTNWSDWSNAVEFHSELRENGGIKSQIQPRAILLLRMSRELRFQSGGKCCPLMKLRHLSMM